MFKKKNHKKNQNTYLITDDSTKGSGKIDYHEVYRNIRTNIEYSTVGKHIKSINITSSIPNESKSTTAINLAMIYATKYKNILLIDCDLRSPSVHHYLNLSNATGLTNQLMDFEKNKHLDEKFIKYIENESFVGKLAVLTSGVKVPNPSELLSSNLFSDFIKALKETYDLIIIDCPPIMSVSDSIPIGNVVDGTVFVCSSQLTNRKDAKAALDILQKNNVKVIGTVLTQVEQDSSHSNYYYYYH